MANKEVYLRELDAQVANLKSWQTEIEGEINGHKTRLNELQQARNNALNNYAAALMPDLHADTIARLNRSAPGFVSMPEIEQLRISETNRLQAQLNDILSRFDPNAYESNRAELDAKLEKELADQNTFNATINDLFSIKGYKELLQSGYGTNAYHKNWWDINYYVDWNNADHVVDRLHKHSWSEVLEDHHNLNNVINLCNDEVERLKAQLKSLTDDEEYLRVSRDALQNIDKIVLDKLHVKLKAKLDSANASETYLPELFQIDKQIQQSQAEINAQLQPRREKVVAQMTQLQNIRMQATRSRHHDVPDEYLLMLRGNAPGNPRQSPQPPVGNYRYSSPAQQYYWREDDWYIPESQTSIMLEFFQAALSSSYQDQGYNEPSPGQRGWGASGYNNRVETYGS
jgi:chromosome segregation ATPase